MIYELVFADTGRIYKVVQWYDTDGHSHSKLLDVFDLTPNEPIRIMEISKQVNF